MAGQLLDISLQKILHVSAYSDSSRNLTLHTGVKERIHKATTWVSNICTKMSVVQYYALAHFKPVKEHEFEKEMFTLITTPHF